MEKIPILFEPLDEPLRVSYPLLKSILEKENIKISDSELLFVWYYACKSSPIYGYKKDKALEAMKMVPDFIKNLSESDYAKYIEKDFPFHVTDAIRLMSAFNPEVRNRAKIYTDRILAHIDYATTMNPADYSEVSDIKSFMDMQINIGKNLPSIIEAAENGYGFKKKEEKENKISGNILEEHD